MAIGDPVIGSEFGPEFDLGTIQTDKIRLKLGAGLAIQPDGTIVSTITNTDTVDKSYVFTATMSGDANQPNVLATITATRTDSPFALAGNEVTYTPAGSADHVIIETNEWYTDPQSGARARVAPEMELLRNGVVVARSASGYQRHSSGHNQSSNGISWVDGNPAGAVYSIRAQQGSSQTDVVNRDTASLSIRAVEKVTVLVP